LFVNLTLSSVERLILSFNLPSNECPAKRAYG
jgi:hypothetical protein